MIKPRIRKRDRKKVYDVRLRDPNGKEYCRTFETKGEAEDFEDDERGARRHGTWVDPRNAARPFSSVADDWLEDDGTKRSSSLARDRSILRTHVMPRLKSKAGRSITRADIQRLVRSWSTTHAPSSVGRMYSCLRAVFSYAVAAEIIAKTPCREIRLPRVDLVDRPSLTPEQLAALADELGDDQAVMMWLGAVLGLRWAECAGLTFGAVDVLHGHLSVRAQLGRDGKLGPPKSAAGRRTMAIPAWLADELAALMARRRLTAIDADRLLFVGERGGPLNYSHWRQRTWVPACDAVDLAGLRFHDLRSLATTALIAEGVDVKTAQTRLGHSSPQVTLAIYARVTAEGDRRAADKVGERFRPRDGRGMVREATRRSAGR
jgi:integrase